VQSPGLASSAVGSLPAVGPGGTTDAGQSEVKPFTNVAVRLSLDCTEKPLQGSPELEEEEADEHADSEPRTNKT
jgi:hypothetical protein